MPRFNFTNISKQSRANIEDVMDNFDKIEELGITDEEVRQRHYTKEQTDEQNENFALKSNMVYSTDEIDTGEKWINNKPIYRKTLKGDTITNNLLDINITNLNIDEIFFNLNRSILHWEINDNPKRWAPITQTAVTREEPTPEPQPAYYQSEIWASDNKHHLYFNLGKRMNADKWVITIEYTKTTD